MFEKEAEEYKLLHTHYEVAKRENDAEYAKRVENVTIQEAFQQGAEFGYNKTNEWHYVKDGDYPKDSGAKLCYIRTAKYVCASYDEKYDCWGFVFNNLDHCIPSSVVIAWKEIVLPKEIKEND